MSLAGGHVLPVSVPVFPWPLPHVSASSPLLIRTVVFGFRVTIPDDQSSDRPFCIPGSRVGAKVPTACSQPPLSQPGPGLGHVGSSCQGAQWCIRGRVVQKGSQVTRSPHGLPTAHCPLFHSAEAPGTCFQGCRETVSYGRWGIHTGRARGFWGWCVHARTAESTAPLYDAGLGAEPHGDHPSASLCKVLQVLCHLISSVPSSRSGWQSCPCFAHTLQGLLPLLRPVPTSC